jgi:hypothetical protein
LIERRVDESLKETFPTSDPPAARRASAGAPPRVSLRKSIVQPFDLAIDLFYFRGNSQMLQSDGRFGMPLNFRRKLIRRSLKAKSQLREIIQFD